MKEKTVLLVDSRQKMQELLRAQLGKRGYRRSCLCRMPSVDCNDYKIVRDSLIVRSFLYRCVTEENALSAFNQMREDYRTESVPAVIIVEKEPGDIREPSETPSNLQGLLQMPIKVRQLRMPDPS